MSKIRERYEKGKAAGPSGIVAEMLNTAVEAGIELVTDLANQIIKERCHL